MKDICDIVEYISGIYYSSLQDFFINYKIETI